MTDKRSLKEVQLELAQEEMIALAQGGGPVQDSSVCVFVMMGLEIEETQCVAIHVDFSMHLLTGTSDGP